MITVHTMAFNEEVFLQYMIDHYRARFPGCHIVINDNESTDNTAKIALENGCEVRTYSTNNQLDDIKMAALKNNCWKNAKTDWVLVCDPDELLNINEQQLKQEEANGTTIIRSEGWNMTNLENNFDFSNIKYGTRVPQYDKSYLFNKSKIQSINYVCGAHSARPIGNIKYSDTLYKLWHYHCINEDYYILRCKWTAARLSEVNKRHGMGSYYLRSEEDIRAGYKNGQEAAKMNRIIE